MPRTTSKTPKDSTAHLGLASRACGIWLAADKRRNHRDAAESKHVVLGLDLLKHISDRFEEHRAKLPTIKQDLDDAMVAADRDNARPKGVLSKDDAHPDLDKHRLGELVGRIGLNSFTATDEGENLGPFTTSSCAVGCLVTLVPVRKAVTPYTSRVHDLACGPGRMDMPRKHHVEPHGGNRGFCPDNTINVSLN